MRSFVLAIAVLASSSAGLAAQSVGTDTMPAAVVQRFVDAANARDLGGMMASVASDAVFTGLPGSSPFAVGRDSIRAHYSRVLASLPAGYTIHVASRLIDGAFVIDHELFTHADGRLDRRATWIYLVTGGQIREAWVLRQPRPSKP